MVVPVKQKETRMNVRAKEDTQENIVKLKVNYLRKLILLLCIYLMRFNNL